MRTMILVLTLAAVCSTRAAESGVKATVTGTATIDVIPASFDVILTIKRKGADARTAVASIKTAREAALTKLAALGMKVELARSENPVVFEKPPPNPQMEAMQPGGNRLKRKDKKDDAPEVRMKQVVRVPFVLAGKDAAAMTLEAENLKAGVLAANLFPEAPFGAEDDSVQDDPPDMNSYSYPGMPKKRGVIGFEFSAARTPDLEQQVCKAAIKNAREKADTLATAAGLKSAEVTAITLQSMDSFQSELINQYYAGMAANDASAQLPNAISGETPALVLRATLLVECLLK